MFEDLPKFAFLTGKGGVGKTSLASANALSFAEAGNRVLLVSADPASHVGQMFGTAIGNRITAIPAVRNLEAIEIDPEAAAGDCREKVVGPLYGHRGAAFGCLHDRDRGLRRVHGPPDRLPEIARVQAGLAHRHAVVAMQATDPVGAAPLRALCAQAPDVAAA